jgi:hypothetical protein
MTLFFESCEKHTRYLAPLLNYRKRGRGSSSSEKEAAEKNSEGSKRKGKEPSQKKGKGKANQSGGHLASKDGKSGGQNSEKNHSKKKGSVDLKSMECYNCGEVGHGSWKCPKCSDPKRIESVKKSKARKAEKDLVSSSNNSNSSSKNTDKNNKTFLESPSQCLDGLIASIIPVTFCLDTGATVSIIDRILANRLREYAGIKCTRIHVELSVVTADEDHKIMIKDKCRVDIQINARCNKMLVCKGVDFYIANMKMTEVILGNQFLMSLGIDVCRELALVATNTPEWNFNQEISAKSARGVEFEVLNGEDFKPP